MDFFFIVVFGVLGAICASFVGVVVARLHTGQSFLKGRSYCDACNTPLSSFSLVPVISFVASKGCAQCCGAHISWMSPLTEVLLGFLFVLTYLTLGLTTVLAFVLLSFTILLALVSYDLIHQILPPGLLYPFVVLSLASGFLSAFSVGNFTETFFVASCIALSLAAIHFFSRGRAMGLADAPLSFGLALLVGPVALTGFVFSFWIGAVVGIVLLVRRPRGSRMGVEVPFAPFLAAGFLLAYFTQWNLFTLLAASL
ncbi:MAG: prepilin peptidase [Candidatus Kaiserbacteria bacterium]|nr:prepilin peptidase [Candidatus Kaiserbacteria bacterium]